MVTNQRNPGPVPLTRCFACQGIFPGVPPADGALYQAVPGISFSASILTRARVRHIRPVCHPDGRVDGTYDVIWMLLNKHIIYM